MLTLVTLALLASIAALLYLYLTWNFNYWRKQDVTTAPTKPLLGSFPHLLSPKQNFADQINDIYKRYSTNEKFVGVLLMRTPQLLVLDPAIIHEILVTQFQSFHDNDTSRVDFSKDVLFAKNPFLLRGKDWIETRAMIEPGMTRSRIKVAYSLTQTVCWKLCQYVEEQSQVCGYDGINGKELALRFTSESIADCVLGIKLPSFKAQMPSITQHFTLFFDNYSTFYLYMLLTNLVPKFIKLKFKLLAPRTDDFFLTLMKEAFANRARNRVYYQDFMDHLITLKERHNINDTEMASHMMTFLIDGLETTGVVIANALYLLARYPATQERLRKEILSNLDDENGELGFDVLNELPYLDACFNETLRILPPSLTFSKICTKSHEFTNSAGKKVPIRVGDVMILPVYSIHRDAKYYPEPEVFKPERFLPENGGLQQYIDRGVFLGFSVGPRACLAKNFALVHSKAAIASIVKRFKISVNARTTDDLKLDPKALIASKDGGIWLDFERVY